MMLGSNIVYASFFDPLPSDFNWIYMGVCIYTAPGKVLMSCNNGHYKDKFLSSGRADALAMATESFVNQW